MSGGYWDYFQYKISTVLEDLNDGDIRSASKYCDYADLERDINILKNHLELAKIYMHRLDWLISADDGVQDYHTRLKEDLEIYLRDLK